MISGRQGKPGEHGVLARRPAAADSPPTSTSSKGLGTSRTSATSSSPSAEIGSTVGHDAEARSRPRPRTGRGARVAEDQLRRRRRTGDGVDPGDAVHARRARRRRRRCRSAARPSPDVLGDDREGDRLVGGEVVPQAARRLPGRVPSGRTRSSGKPNSTLRNGRPRTSRSDDDDGHDRNGPAHDRHGDAVPEALAHRLGGGRRRTDHLSTRGPSTASSAGKRQRGAARPTRSTADAGVGERAQEDQREDEQGRQRDRDGQGAEGDRAPGGLDRADDAPPR